MNSCLALCSQGFKITFYLLFMFFLSSCTAFKNTGSATNPPVPISKSIPTAHVWQYLNAFGQEDLGYATYSYVLVGRDENNQKSTELYYELVKAIQSSTANRNELPHHISKKFFNLFLIPVSGLESEQKKPNYALSKSLLSTLSATSPLSFSRPGPYVITLYQPIGIGTGDEMADILYLDLTNSHPQAIPEIVSTFREHLLNEELKGIEKLKSLRLALLNLALHTEDSIGFAKTAYASIRTGFEP